MTAQFPSDERQVARSQNEDGSWNFSQVDISEVSFKGRFGVLAGSFSSNTISIGIKSFALIEAPDPEIRVGDDIQITSLSDVRIFMWGEVIGTSTNSEGGTVLSVFADDLSSVGTGETYDFWEIQVVARPKPGIEKDTSTTSVNPTTSGPWTFTVTADKFFPLGGTLLIKPTADRSVAVLGRVNAYSSTSLVVEKTFTNAAVSQSYDSWSIALLDAPVTALASDEQQGLIIKGTLFPRITVTAGRVRDSTDTIDLVFGGSINTLETGVDFNTSSTGVHVRVSGDGTITSAGVNVTGTGTNFLTIFGNTSGAVATQYDYGTTSLDDRFPAYSEVALRYTISTDAASASVAVGTVTDTVLATSIDLGASGSTWYRGGCETHTGTVWYLVLLVRNDTTSNVRVALSSPTPTGIPDLPSGHTYYRVIGLVSLDHNNLVADIIQDKSISSMSVAGNNGQYAGPFHSLTPSLGSDAVLRESGNVLGFGTIATAGITDAAVSNAKLANMAAYTLKGRNAGTSGDPSDIDITALTEQASPTTTDYLIGVDTAASNAFKKYKASNFGGGTTFPADMGLITEAATVTFDCGTIV